MTIQETLKAIDNVTERLNNLKIQPPPRVKREMSLKTMTSNPKQGDLGGNKISAATSMKSLGQYPTGGTGNTNRISSPGSHYNTNSDKSNNPKQPKKEGKMSITQ